MTSEPSTSTQQSQKQIRDEILHRLEQRNTQLRSIARIFSNYAGMAEDLKKSRLKTSKARTTSDASNDTSSAEVFLLTEKLASLREQKSKNDQDLIEVSRRLGESQVNLKKVTEERDKLKTDMEKMCARIAQLEHSLRQASEEKETLRDESVALHAIVESQKTKLLDLEKDQFELIQRVRVLNEERAALMNAEVDNQQRLQEKRIQEKILAAINETTTRTDRTNSTCSNVDETPIVMYGDQVPQRAQAKFEVDDGEINDAIWISSELFSTAGGDRKVRNWRVDPNGKPSKVSTLLGCNQAVTRLDYDGDTRTLLASSNDHAVRLWNFDTQRIMSTFTTHTDKVTSVRFYQTHQAISGSSDRSIKVWDLRGQRCIKSFFPGSTVHDVARSTLGGATFYSGHYDKKVRVWDGRANEPMHTKEMGGKVTSLDVSTDGMSLLVSTRDDTLSLLDVRNFKIVHIYSAEQYHTSSDVSRCVLSPGMEYCAAGSSDGNVYIWNVASTKLEKTLAKGHDHAVLAVKWNPSGWGLLSCDKQKRITLWQP